MLFVIDVLKGNKEENDQNVLDSSHARLELNDLLISVYWVY